MAFSSVELCAGGGGQSLGLELAGFHHEAVVEYESLFCTTLRKNRPHWNVLEMDIREFTGQKYSEVDLLAAGVPCPPFSTAGKQLGADDDRDMFPAALSLVSQIKPRAVLFENVQGLASAKFMDYRNKLIRKLSALGYQPDWRVLQAAEFGVPQLRPRFILVALRPSDAEHFAWPVSWGAKRYVGESLLDLMAENGWAHAETWAGRAACVAPTLVGGSKKHGGPDLGPTRAKRQWRDLGVDGMGIADSAPGSDKDADHLPRLTLRMAARIQSFPDTWEFAGGKTAQYRQIGNAFPPAVARVVGAAIRSAFERKKFLSGLKFEKADQLRLMELPSRSKPKTRKKSV